MCCFLLYLLATPTQPALRKKRPTRPAGPQTLRSRGSGSLPAQALPTRSRCSTFRVRVRVLRRAGRSAPRGARCAAVSPGHPCIRTGELAEPLAPSSASELCGTSDSRQHALQTQTIYPACPPLSQGGDAKEKENLTQPAHTPAPQCSTSLPTQTPRYLLNRPRPQSAAHLPRPLRRAELRPPGSSADPTAGASTRGRAD